MKKTVLIGFGIAVLLAAVFWADKNFPAGGKQTQSVTGSTDTASVENVPIKDLQDHDVTLADYRGKVVLVNFWATWCAPCQIEIPWMIEFRKKYGTTRLHDLGCFHG